MEKYELKDENFDRPEELGNLRGYYTLYSSKPDAAIEVKRVNLSEDPKFSSWFTVLIPKNGSDICSVISSNCNLSGHTSPVGLLSLISPNKLQIFSRYIDRDKNDRDKKNYIIYLTPKNDGKQSENNAP